MSERAQEGIEQPAGRRSNLTKFIVGGAIIVAVIVYLIFSSIGGSTAYYLTISELKARGEDALDRKVRVVGLVQGETIQFDARNLDLYFVITDEGGSMPVKYKGARPDMLQDQAEAVVEGKLTAAGEFEATNLLLKCPSKYEEAATSQAQTR